jgi:anti-sigma regulatory factor (Ser/Thr protein kinase)
VASASIQLRIPPTSASVPISRRRVRGWLDDIGLDAETAASVLLVVSELVTNGVIHDGGEDIVLSASGDRSGVSLQVITADGQNPPRPLERGSDPAETGRGLMIVDALAESVAAVEHGCRRYVGCRVAAHQERRTMFNPQS